LGLPDLFGLLDLSFWALEVSGVELFLPPVIGAPGYAYLSQVTATGWGLSKVEDFKANPSLFGESMDLSELSDELPWGSSPGGGFPEYADRLFVPFVLLFIPVQGLPSLRFFGT
jgi:hypothetical protein